MHKFVVLPGLFAYVRDAKLHRKNIFRKRRKRLIRLARHRYRGWKGWEYDETLGFPGEGWQNFSASAWNPRSLTKERFEYAVSLGYDILALPELWRRQSEFQTSTKQFIVSELIIRKKGPKKGQTLYPNDRAAGVGILLSPRMQKKVNSFDSRGERMCWVLGKTKGPGPSLQFVCGDSLFDAQSPD